MWQRAIRRIYGWLIFGAARLLGRGARRRSAAAAVLSAYALLPTYAVNPYSVWDDESVVAMLRTLPPHYAGISRVASGTAAASATFVSVSGLSAGDLIVVAAYDASAATAPTLPAGYTSITSGTGNTNGMRVGYKWSNGTETTGGTWTNSSEIGVVTLRGAHFIGANTQQGASSATMTYGALTLQDTGARSWVVAFGGNRTAAANTAPTGLTSVAHTSRLVCSDSEGAVSSWSSQTVSGNTNTGFRTAVVEVRDQVAQATGAGVPAVAGWRQSNPGPSAVSAGAKTFRMPLTRPTLAGNLYCLLFAVGTGASVTVTAVKDSSGASLNQRLLNTSFTGASGNTYGIYDIVNAAAGLTYVEVTVSGPIPNNFVAAVIELYNVPTSSPADGTATCNETSGGTAHQPGAITTTGSNSVVLSFGTQVGAATWLGAQISPGDGATLLGADSVYGTMCQWQIQAVAGSPNPQFNLDAADDLAVGVVAVAYKAGSAGTAPTGNRVFGWQDWNKRPVSGTSFTTQFPCQGDLAVVNWCGVGAGSSLNCTLALKDNKGNTWTARTPEEWNTPIVNDQQYVDTDAGTLSPSQGLILTGTLSHNDGGSTACLLDVVGSGAPGCFGAVSNATGTNNATQTWDTVSLTPTAGALVLLNEDQAIGTAQSDTGGSNWICQSVFETTAQSGGTFGNGFMNDRAVGWGVPPTAAAITFTVTIDPTGGTPGSWGASAAYYKAPAGTFTPLPPLVKSQAVRRASSY